MEALLCATSSRCKFFQTGDSFIQVLQNRIKYALLSSYLTKWANSADSVLMLLWERPDQAMYRL